MAVSNETKQSFAEALLSIHADIMTWVNNIHEMTGPDRLEIRETVVEARKTPAGNEFDITSVYVIGDIEAACHVLVERLKG